MLSYHSVLALDGPEFPPSLTLAMKILISQAPLHQAPGNDHILIILIVSTVSHGSIATTPAVCCPGALRLPVALAPALVLPCPLPSCRLLPIRHANRRSWPEVAPLLPLRFAIVVLPLRGVINVHGHLQTRACLLLELFALPCLL